MRYVLLCLFLGVVLSLATATAAYKVYTQEESDRAIQLFDGSTVDDYSIDQLPEVSMSRGGNQRNILVVLVDRLAEPNPSLEGMWLVVYLLETPRLTFLPIFPCLTSGSTALADNLGDLDPFNSGGELAPALLETVAAKDIRWDEVLVFDKTSLAVLIDLSGGLDTSLGLVNGTQAVAQLPATGRDPRIALENQTLLIRSICQKMDRLLENHDTPRLLELLAGRVFSKDEFMNHFPEWRRFQESKGDMSCEFPTLEGISLLAPPD